MMMDDKEHPGSCHCGNISYRFTTRHAVTELPVRRCTCSFCRRHGSLYTSDPEGALHIEVSDPGAAGTYRFGTKVVHFVICRTCGVMPFALAPIDGGLYAVVAANSMEAVPPAPAGARPLELSSETVEEGMRRRKRTWIGRVTIDGWPGNPLAASPETTGAGVLPPR